ncbi:MAG: GGDEF domain-containing protein [Geminicoccaceae bacterium]
MTSERTLQLTRARASEVLHALERSGVTPTPENYRVWYVHLSGELPALSARLRQIVEAGETLGETHFAELHERFFLRAAEERSLLRAGQRLNDLAGELTREVATFSEGTAQYGRTLSEANRDFDDAPNSERIVAIVAGIIAETSRMQERSDHIEGRLRASMSEIDKLRREVHAAWNEARTDGLTGLANRRHFDQAVRAIAAQSIESGLPACLMLADIDHFKQFNDRFGHGLGDQVLKLVAAVLRQNVKGRDVVARYGGEEFAVILPATRLEDGLSLAENLRELVATRQIQLKDSNRSLGRVTLSIGVAAYRPGEPCPDWVERADGALYLAKRGGRNCVIVKGD